MYFTQKYQISHLNNFANNVSRKVVQNMNACGAVSCKPELYVTLMDQV